MRETPLETSFCGHAILAEDFMMVPDATKDPRFHGNPLVTSDPGLRFYAGALLKTSEGLAIGTMCVLDYQPKTLSAHQIHTLKLLAKQAMTQLELRVALSETRKNEERHRQVLNSAVDYAIISIDMIGRVTGWNKGAENILGWGEEEMIGQSADIFFAAEDKLADIAGAEMSAARAQGRSRGERWHLRKNGSRFFARGEMMPLRDGAGDHIGYVKILRDRTRDRRRSQRLASIAAISEVLLTTDDPAEAIYPILEQASRDIGFEQSFIYSVLPDDHLALSYATGADEAFKASLRHVSFDVPICGEVARNGRPLILSDLQIDLNPRYAIARERQLEAYVGLPIFSSGGVAGVISFCSGETREFDAESLAFFETVARFLSLARQRADREKSLKNSEERSRMAQEAGRVGTFELDIRSAMVEVSPEFCRAFGLPVASTYPAARFEAMVVAEDRDIASNDSTRRSGTSPLHVEYRIEHPDGSVRWIARRADMIFDADRRAIRMLGTVQDVTERKRIETQQAALLKLGERLRNATDAAEIAWEASQALGVTLNVSRAGYARIDIRADLFAVDRDWAACGVSSLAGKVSLGVYKAAIATLSTGRMIAVNDVQIEKLPPEDLERYHQTHVRAHIKVPLIQSGELVGLLYVHQDKPRVWKRDEIDFVLGVADYAYAAMGKIKAEGEQRILNGELSHRLKNTLAMVQAIAMQTLKNVSEKDAVDALIARIQALSRAYDILFQENWVSGRILDVIQAVLRIFDLPKRYDITGPNVQIGPKSALSLSLILHELTTNAIKYGALSNDTGRVAIVWRRTMEAELVMEWRESGGPQVIAPTGRKGFGSRLIGLGLVGTGGVEVRYESQGLVVEMRAPMTQIEKQK